MFPTRRIATMGGDIFRDEYSIDFDGTNDYLDLGNTNDLGTGAFSFAFWIKVDDWTSNYIMSKREDDNNRWFFISNGSDQILFQCDVGGVTKMNAVCTTILTPYENQWLHLAFTSNRSGTNRWFINGKLINTDTDSNSDDWDNSGSLYINRLDTNYGSAGSSNKISEIVRYNVALSSSEVATIYNGREPYNHKEGVASSNLKGWWRMGDGKLDEFASANGVIGDATDATLGSNITPTWSTANGAVIDGQTITLGESGVVSATGTVTQGVHKINVTITSYSGTGSIEMPWDGGGSSNQLISANGIYEYYELAGDDGWIVYAANGRGCTVTINSIQKLDGNAGVMTNMDAVDFVGDTP